MSKPVVLLTFLVLSVCAYILYTANTYPDEYAHDEYAQDEYAQDEHAHKKYPTVPADSASSYEKALQVWNSPEDINGWIAANFSYDTQRAQRLSETRRVKHESVSIYSPSKLFKPKTGVCVDLSRFSVETLKQIDPHFLARISRSCYAD